MNKITIKGVTCEYVEILGVKCIPCIFDPMKEKIRYLKSIEVDLHYGANDLPLSVSFEKGYDLNHLKMLNIDYTNIKRESWLTNA